MQYSRADSPLPYPELGNLIFYFIFYSSKCLDQVQDKYKVFKFIFIGTCNLKLCLYVPVLLE